MSVYPIRRRLPVSHIQQIGRIVTRWALLEWHLKQIGYLLLDVTPKQGRLAVREPRPIDYMTMLEDLLKLKGIKVGGDWKKVKKSLGDLQRERDAIAHGVWLRVPGQKWPVLQVTTGKWATPRMPKTKRIVDPEARPFTPERLRHIVRQIDIASSIIEDFEARLRHDLSASPQRSNAK